MPQSLLSIPTPIPPLVEPPNWARLPIVECGEPLVTVVPTERLQVRSLYAEQGIPNAPTEIHVRAGVLARLRQAVSHLPTDISLVIFDGYRPLTVQRYLYETYQAEIAAQNPHLAPHELANRVMEFVASPNADPTCPPPHRSGGAVDVYLISRETGEMLPMGTQPDETSPHSITRYFEENPEEPFTTNRRLLFQAMTSAGFTNYRGEWWHYDFGNQRWANCSGTDHALYGIPLSESGFSG